MEDGDWPAARRLVNLVKEERMELARSGEGTPLPPEDDLGEGQKGQGLNHGGMTSLPS